MNWFIPALVNSSVGSSAGTSDELGTMRWPFRSKYRGNCVRISREVISGYCTGSGAERIELPGCVVLRRGLAQRGAAMTAAGLKPWRIRYW